MGNGDSKQFKDTPAIKPNEAKANQGKCVVVYGRVSAAECAIIPPFGLSDAVVIRTQAMNEYSGGACGFKQEKKVFSGFSAVDFHVRGADGVEVDVDVSNTQGWKFLMRDTHLAWCVAYDNSKGGIVSTTAGRGMYSQRALCPEAKTWHDEFKTKGAELHKVGEHAFSFKGDSKGSKVYDKVREMSIQIGDAVAVLGTLKLRPMGEGGMFLDAGIITNNPKIATQLQSGSRTVPEFEMPASSPNRIPMRKAVQSPDSA